MAAERESGRHSLSTDIHQPLGKDRPAAKSATPGTPRGRGRTVMLSLVALLILGAGGFVAWQSRIPAPAENL